jgi:hypothetical protein
MRTTGTKAATHAFQGAMRYAAGHAVLLAMILVGKELAGTGFVAFASIPGLVIAAFALMVPVCAATSVLLDREPVSVRTAAGR